jgi:hypothetical protein
MDAVVPLFGVVIGGLLVLVTDFIRRRIEWRRDLVKTLAASGSNLVVILHRTVGELAEARETAQPVKNPNAGRAERLQAYSRFYANPGSRALRADVDRVLAAHRAVRAAQEAAQDVWDDAAREYWEATESFELALHRAVVRGRPPRDPRRLVPGAPPDLNLGVHRPPPRLPGAD